MPDINSYPGIYQYRQLPVLAKFILDKHLEEFATQLLKLSRQYNVPLLKFLANYTDAQLNEINVKSVTELLSCLAANKSFEFIQTSLQKWLANQMEVVGKYDVVAEDITLLNHVRGKTLKSYAIQLYKGSELSELLNEIDDFLLASVTSASNTFITILKSRIEEEEEFKAKLSNALPGSVYVIDWPANKVLLANNKLSDVLGYSLQQLNEATIEFYQSITHPDDWVRMIEHANNLKSKKGTVHSIELRLRDNRGKYRWIRNYETSLKSNSDGEMGEVIGVAFDVTGEKEITEALAIREAQLLEAQSIAHIGSFEWDITGRSSTTNTNEIYRIFEFTELEKFEQFMKYVHADDVQKVEDAIRESFKTGNYECVYRYVRNSKEKIIWSKGIVTIVEGNPVKMVGTVQDVTTMKRIEAELKEKTIELERSNESLQQFASIASHDMKEPLRKISVLSSKVLSAEKDKLSEGSTNSLHKVYESAVRMQRMIDDILQFSFTEGNQQKQEVSLEEILSEVKDLLSEIILDKKAVIYSDGLPSAFVISSQIRQLFQNLIANALKFSKADEQPIIKITHSYLIDKLSASGDIKQLEIAVGDNGIGFDEKDGEKIFGLFYRIHSKSKFEGSGLGLSICKKIVESHGGKITAQSKPGEGSIFKIVLPV